MYKHIVAASLLILAAACASQLETKPAASGSDGVDALVARRAEARWQHLIDKQYGLAYDYMSPGFRSVTSKDAYVRSTASTQVRWRTARVQDVDCQEQDVCRLFIDVKSEVKIPATGGEMLVPTPTKERWIRSGNEWYFLPEQ